MIENELKLTFINGRQWEVNEEFKYTTNCGYQIFVPKGFKSPSHIISSNVLFSIFTNSKYLPATITYNFIDRELNSVFTGEQKSQIYLDLLEELGASKFKLKLIKNMLLVFGD